MSADTHPVSVASPSSAGSSVAHWDRVAQKTTWGRYLTDVERQVIVQGLEWIEQPGHALDLGCGSGRWSSLLAERGWTLTCTDVSEPALAICRRKVPSAACILMQPGDRTFPAETASAQLALCIEVVPLIESSWFIGELRRVLAERGLFIGVYLNGRSLRGLAWRLKQRLSNGRNGVSFYQNSYPAWRERLLASGFEMLHEESCCWGPFARDSNSPFVPACAKLERALRLHRVVTWSPWIVFIARRTTSGVRR
jgi:SAM-dependent methyltransferase